jgi:hypothetical protein
MFILGEVSPFVLGRYDYKKGVSGIARLLLTRASS